MNAAMSWSVKGIEPDVREAAKLAARKSGQTLGQWLNAMIRDSAERRSDIEEPYAGPERTPPRRTGDAYEDRIEHLEQELAQLTHRQTDTAIAYRHGAGATVDPGATPLQHLLERLDRNERETVRAFETLHDRIGSLSQELTETRAEAVARSETPENEAFETALRNVVDHIESADQENRDILADLNARLDDLSHEMADQPKGADSANQKILGDVERRLTALAHRVDQIGDIDQGEITKNIEGRLSHLADQVEQIATSASEEIPAEVDERLSELAHRVESAERIANETHTELNESLEQRLGHLGDRLESIRETSRETAEQAVSIAVQSTQEDFREIETQVRELAAQIQASAGLDPETEKTIAGLMQQMSGISQDMQQIKVEAASENDVQSLKSGLDNLSNIMEQKFANATHEGAFAALEQRLNEVSQRLEHTIDSPPGVSQVENLERRVHEIDARLAASQGETRTEELVNALGAQIDGLSQRVAQSEQQSSGIQAIEKSIAQLFESVEQTRTFATEAAEQAAGRVADQMLGDDGGEDSAAIQAIKQGLEALKASAEHADKRNQETLEAVHDTLEKVITRLVALEEAPGDAAPGTTAPGAAQEPQASATPASENQGSDTQVSASELDDLQLPPIPPMPSLQGFGSPQEEGEAEEPAWKDAVDAKKAEQMEELFAEGEPPLPPLAEPSDEDSQDAPAEPVGDGASRRNDFIAAARRAAQSMSDSPEMESGTGPFKSLRRGRRGKKTAEGDAANGKTRRPLILAAIVLLMIGAASAYKFMGGKGSSADPAQVTAPEPIEEVPPRDEATPAEAAPEPERQSWAITPTPLASADPEMLDVQSLTSRTLATQIPGLGKQSLAETEADPLPPTPASGKLTTGSVEAPDKTPNMPSIAPTDPMLLAMPWMQPATSPALTQEATPAEASAKPDSPETSKADPAPVKKTTKTTTTQQMALPPAAVGPMGMRVAAANGDPVAQFLVATAYTEGKTVKQNFRIAAQWYQRAAGRGLAPAQYRLGTFYEKGKGVPQDVAAARIWYERAAEKGNRKAMHNLAVIYADGSRGTPDFNKAGIWFRNAAELGLKDSQYNLGILHERGLGVAKDLSQAYKWFALAAKQGDRDAETRMHRIEERLAPQALVQVKLEVERWTVKASDTTANVVSPPADGWKHLAAKYNSPTFAKREMVAEAQLLLNKLGYSAGPSDGLLGARTRDAIRHFQKANDLTETGTITPELIETLRKKTG